MLDPASVKNMTPLGNGPYMFSGHQTVETLTLVSSDRALSKKPYIDQLNVLLTTDRDTDFYAFDQGMVDAASGEITRWGKYLGSKEYRVIDYPSTDFDFIGFNHNNPIFQDKAVREAVAHATPYDRILSEVYVNYAAPAKTPVHPDSWLYAPDVVARATDANAVKETLSGAGWMQSADTELWRKTPALPGGATLNLSFSILVNEENEERMKIAELLSESLREADIITAVEAVDFETYETRLAERDFDVFIGGYHLSPIPDFSFMLKSTNADFGTNLLNYKDTATDALLAATVTSITETGYKKAMTELQTHIAKELPLISLAFRDSAIVVNKQIHGEIRPNLNNKYANINEWYVN
jgi:peptide/nickel transport system substrate-binding protein